MNLTCKILDHKFDLTPIGNQVNLTCVRCGIPLLSEKAGDGSETRKTRIELFKNLTNLIERYNLGESK